MQKIILLSLYLCNVNLTLSPNIMNNIKLRDDVYRQNRFTAQLVLRVFLSPDYLKI